MAAIEDVIGWFYTNNQYLEFSNRKFERMKLLKLLFLSHGYFDAHYGEELFDAEFQAWTEGPVDIQAYAKHWQNDFPIFVSDNQFSEKELEILNMVNDIYGIYSAEALSEATHSFSSWSSAYKEDDQGNAIKYIVMDKKLIKKDFEIAKKNLEHFSKLQEDYIVQLVNGVTFLVDKNELDRYENFISTKHDEIVKLSSFLKGEKEFLCYVNINDEGNLIYEV